MPRADETASRASGKEAHYSEDPRESIFYLVGKSRKLPPISPVKDYPPNPAIRSSPAERGGGSRARESPKEGGRDRQIPGGLQPNFRPGSNVVSTDPAATGSLNSLPSNRAVELPHYRRTYFGFAVPGARRAWSIDLFVRR